MLLVVGDSKAEIRNKVWDYLTDNRLASFPFPPHRRISNFKVDHCFDVGAKGKMFDQICHN